MSDEETHVYITRAGDFDPLTQLRQGFPYSESGPDWGPYLANDFHPDVLIVVRDQGKEIENAIPLYPEVEK